MKTEFVRFKPARSPGVRRASDKVCRAGFPACRLRRFPAARAWKAVVQGAGKPPEPAGSKACPTVVDFVTGTVGVCKVSALFLAMMAALKISAQTSAFTYQGQLTHSGSPANGSYDLTFALFDAASAGNQLGGVLTNTATPVTSGLFTVTLDFGNQFPGANRWLEIGVVTNGGGTFTTLAPRQQITATPYAMQAASANTAANANAVNASNILGSLVLAQLPPALVTNGASGLTLAGSFVGDGSGLSNLSPASINGVLTPAQIPGLDASKIVSGTVPLGQLPASLITNGASGVNFTGTFTGNGAGLASLNATNIASGTLSDARLSTNVALLNSANFFAGTNRFSNVVLATNSNNQFTGAFTGNGGALSALNAANISSGTLSDARLSANVALLNAPNVFTAVNRFSGALIGTNVNNQFTGVFTGNGSGLTQLPAAVVTNGEAGLNLTGTFTGSGAGLTNVPGTLAAHLPAAATITALPNSDYNLTNALATTLSLPSTAAVGDVVEVNGLGTGSWQVGVGVNWTARDSSRAWTSVASSADGSRLVAAPNNDYIYTSTDSGVTWIARGFVLSWSAVASSADGSKLLAAGSTELYTSTDGGATWVARNNIQNWYGLASSDDGTFLVAVAYGGQIYTSTNSGATWTARDSVRSWHTVASSADGSKLVAAVYGGQIYTSTNSGVTWFPTQSNRYWTSVASSADGTSLVAVGDNDYIYTSTDSGVTWTPRDSVRGWFAVASSADGSRLAAVEYGGQIHTSMDGGATWTARDHVRNWYTIASSADGSKLVAAVNGGQIYTSAPLFDGGPGVSQQFQYAGNGVWQPLGISASQILGGIPLSSLAGAVVTNKQNGLTLNGTFTGDGSGLINLNASQLTSGSVPPGTLTSVPAANLTGSVPSASLTSIPAGNLTGSIPPGALTSVPAASLTGTIADALLPANVPLLNGTNLFTGTNRFASYVGIGTTNPQGQLHVVGASGTSGAAPGPGAPVLLSAGNGGDDNTPVGSGGNGGGITLGGGRGGNDSSGQGGSGATIVLQGGAGAVSAGGAGGNIVLTPGAGGSPSGQSGRVGVGTSNPVSSLDVNGTVTATSFSGNAGGLTNLPAGNLAGTVADARLSGNVALLSVAQTFSGTNIFNTAIGIGTNNPQASLDVNGSLRINQGTKFSRVQDGVFTAGPTTNLVVTGVFPIAFSNTPTVVATSLAQAGSDFGDTFCVTVRKVTTTNFVVNIVRVDQTNSWGQNLRIAYHAWE
ncbi:MAG: hypothetical protein C5B50_00320 [Verrucomicrobia bacterium]|nr:MAG: hypothetical protein C5B50_00320 [Verrucomicrobiota bacterium]